MAEKIVRALKGFLMGALFMIFLLGILFLLLIVLPILLVLDRVLGPTFSRMQGAIGILVSFWLFLLKGCGLLAAKAGTGQPMDGPCVIVSNHPGLFDVLFLMRDIPRLSLMVKRSLATKLPLGPVFRSAGYVLSPDIDQAGPFESLEEAREKISRGYKFMIFPEGTRSPKGKLGKFHAGAFLLARLANVPVQPLLIKNDPPFLSKKDPWYLPSFRVSTVAIDFWEPIAPPRAGQERELARNLEAKYRKALGLGEKRKRI
jgi:1-acyl-sn-glycerol-3-phosphate acyltransferase